MTLAAVAFHGVTSSIGAWRRDVRRSARLARAGCRVAPLSTVRQPLPPTLFGDALMSLCGDRLRAALEAPYVAPTSPPIERERRPRVPNALPLSSADADGTSTTRVKAADANASRAWQPLGEQDAGARPASSARDDVVQHRDAAWKPSANRDDLAMRTDFPVRLDTHAPARAGVSAARIGELNHTRSPGDVPSPLAIALRRLQHVSAPSAPTAAPKTSAPVPLPQHDGVATRETSHTDRTQRSSVVRSAQDEAGSSALDGNSGVHSSSGGRQPWWASGVDEIHARNVQRTPIARPVAATIEAPEEAFAEMLADVLRQQAIQHGVLVP